MPLGLVYLNSVRKIPGVVCPECQGLGVDNDDPQEINDSGVGLSYCYNCDISFCFRLVEEKEQFLNGVRYILKVQSFKIPEIN